MSLIGQLRQRTVARLIVPLAVPVLISVGCVQSSDAPFVIDDVRVPDQAIADAAGTWLVATGWQSEDPLDMEIDPTLWRGRFEETCDQEAFTLERFVELAERYAVEDLPSYGPPRGGVVNVAHATDGLWTMAASLCGHLFLDDTDPSGLPFDDLTDNGTRTVRGDTTWQGQSTPRVLDSAGAITAVTWLDYRLPLSPPSELELRRDDTDTLVMWMFSSTCAPVVTVQSVHSDGQTHIAVAVYDYVSEALGESNCGDLEKPWELVIELNEPLDDLTLSVFDDRTDQR